MTIKLGYSIESMYIVNCRNVSTITREFTWLVAFEKHFDSSFHIVVHFYRPENFSRKTKKNTTHYTTHKVKMKKNEREKKKTAQQTAIRQFKKWRRLCTCTLQFYNFVAKFRRFQCLEFCYFVICVWLCL